ncbi:YfaZ family outer membrane protein [uncultured Kushneria sp.]|uniref:YfaZ family outer membrane protein n=1 Tax=uncultured Kushneria sp. TaxID=905033 RepID=UPI00261890BD|nr:YfaZ family outer membrane protein [uncultured Kushneria sp.]
MKKIIISVLGAGLALSSLNASALSLSASGGKDSHGFQATQGLLPGFSAGLGYFSTNDSGNNTKAYSGQLMFSPYLPGVDVSVGGRYQYLDSDYGDGGGLGLGGSAYVDTPIPRVSVGGYGFYTPEGLAHGDVNESYEYGARARATLIANTYGYVGYRYYHTDFDNHDGKTLFSGPELGVSVGF